MTAFAVACAAEDQPSIIPILANSRVSNPLLNDNIVGQLFTLKLAGDNWRIEVTNFDPFSRLFSASTNRWDIDPATGQWKEFHDLDLNELFSMEKLKHIPKGAALKLPNITSLRQGVLFDKNVLNRCIEVRSSKSRRARFQFAVPSNFNQPFHTVAVGGRQCELNLNQLLVDHSVRTPTPVLPITVVNHWLSILHSPGQSPLRPMPFGGRQQIT
tara:strand:- start:17 stop:658 length:642 start_codon:yes stop_codon:yes gene_type:complete